MSGVEETLVLPVYATWDPGGMILDEHVELSIGDPELNFFSGEFSHDAESREGIFLGLRINPEDRNNKFGTRLASALAYLAASRGVVELHGGVESQHVIKIFRSLFGEGRLSYYDHDPTTADAARVNLPISTDEAVSMLEGYEKFEKDIDYRSIGFGVCINLIDMDIELLEQPIEQNARPKHPHMD